MKPPLLFLSARLPPLVVSPPGAILLALPGIMAGYVTICGTSKYGSAVGRDIMRLAIASFALSQMAERSCMSDLRNMPELGVGGVTLLRL